MLQRFVANEKHLYLRASINYREGWKETIYKTIGQFYQSLVPFLFLYWAENFFKLNRRWWILLLKKNPHLIKLRISKSHLLTKLERSRSMAWELVRLDLVRGGGGERLLFFPSAFVEKVYGHRGASVQPWPLFTSKARSSLQAS